MKEFNIKDMSLRDVMEMTKNMSLREGGLSLLIEKIVSCIEELQEKT